MYRYIKHTSTRNVLYFSYGIEDKELKDMSNITKDVMELLGNGLPADFLPILKYFPASRTEKQFIKLMNQFLDFLMKNLEEHIQRHKDGNGLHENLIVCPRLLPFFLFLVKHYFTTLFYFFLFTTRDVQLLCQK